MDFLKTQLKFAKFKYSSNCLWDLQNRALKDRCSTNIYVGAFCNEFLRVVKTLICLIQSKNIKSHLLNGLILYNLLRLKFNKK